MAPTPRRRVYLDDLLDVHEVAELLGLAGATAIGAYRAARKADGSLKWPDFPDPVLPRALPREGAAGRSYYWLRQDIERWRARHPPPPRRPEAGTPDEQA